jgi:peptide deformylase
LARKEILKYPKNEAALRRKCEPVEVMGRKAKRLIRDLKDTLAAHSNGVGLAAPQIGAHLRVVIVQLGSAEQSVETQRRFTALVNPVILEADQERRDFDGCLSFPGLFGETIRPHYLRLSGLDEQGKPFERTFEGFDAVVVHHEIDHLDGVLFIDRIERMQDLYRLEKDPSGKSIRVPVSSILSREIQPGHTGKPGLVRSSGSKDFSRDAASSTPINPNRE